MTVYNFTNVLVKDAIGGTVKLARNQRVDVLDPSSGAVAAGLTQNGQPVPYLTSDKTGHVTFAATIPVVRLTAQNGVWQDVPSNDLWSTLTPLGTVPFAADGEVSTTKPVRADDSRIQNRAPSARTLATGLGLLGGGDLTANRTLSVDFATSGTSSPTQAVRADDVRLANPRTPTAHAASHAMGGTDAITAASIGAETPAGAQSKANAALSSAQAYANTLAYGSSLSATDATVSSFFGSATATQAAADARYPRKDWQPLNVRDFGAVGDGAADDTTAVTNAVSAAISSGRRLFWPVGTYKTVSTIPALHDPRHFGPGVISRSGYLFSPESTATGANRIYVSPTGNNSNDGLSPSQPMQTIQAAFDTLVKYGPMLDGDWRVVLAAGSYSGDNVLDGLRSKKRIWIQGPSVGGHPNVPTAIVQGTPTSNIGIYFQNRVYAFVQDVAFRDFNAFSGSTGITADAHCNIWTNNVHASGCGWAGISVNFSVRLYVSGGIFDANRKGIRVYANSNCSIGYQGTTTTNRPQITNSTEFGVEVRDSSTGHLDYTDIIGCPTGLHIWNQSRVASDYPSFQTCNIGILAQTFSSWDTATSATFTGNGKDKAFHWSAHSADENLFWDPAAGRMRFGGSGTATPPTPFHFYKGAAGAAWSSALTVGVESNSDALIGLASPTANSTGLIFGNPTSSAAGSLKYVNSDNSLRLALNGVQKYRFTSAGFQPETDDTQAIGTSAFRMSDAWVARFRPGKVGASAPTWTAGAGTPEGAVTGTVGSLYTRTDGAAGTTLYVKESGTGNTGWVAK